MSKKNKKACKRQAAQMMKLLGYEVPKKKAVGGLDYKSKNKISNPHTNPKDGKRMDCIKKSTPTGMLGEL